MCPNTSKRLLRVCRSLVVCYQIWSHTSFSYGTVVVLWHSYRQEISWKRFYLSVMQDSWRELANAFANGRTLFSLHSTHQVSCLLERLRGAARALEPRTQKAIYEMGFSVMNSVLVLLEVYKHELQGNCRSWKAKLWSSVACAVGDFLGGTGYH
uniref:Uncharacterized protein n=1 Tax=Vitis vinifera TaxID=29760 RepID=A5ARC2_VITVI|nr:hypothetical protein VITISV_014171 [Vitis vinifera]